MYNSFSRDLTQNRSGVLFFNPNPNGIYIPQIIVAISLVKYSSLEVIIHTIFALQMLLLRS